MQLILQQTQIVSMHCSCSAALTQEDPVWFCSLLSQTVPCISLEAADLVAIHTLCLLLTGQTSWKAARACTMLGTPSTIFRASSSECARACSTYCPYGSCLRAHASMSPLDKTTWPLQQTAMHQASPHDADHNMLHLQTLALQVRRNDVC